MATFQIKTQQRQQQQQTERTATTATETATATAAGRARTNLKHGHKSTDFGVGHWRNGQHQLAAVFVSSNTATTYVAGRQQQQQQQKAEAKDTASCLAHASSKAERRETRNLLVGGEDGEALKKRSPSRRSRNLTSCTRTFTSCHTTTRTGAPLSYSAAFGWLANIFRLDASASLIMLTMLAVATVVISGHGVAAAQRDVHKSKDIDNTSNANAIAAGIGGSGNGNMVNNGIADGNNQNRSMPVDVTSTTTTTLTTTKTTATATASSASASASASSASPSSSLTLSTYSAAAYTSSANVPNSLKSSSTLSANFRRTATTSTTTTTTASSTAAAAVTAAATATATTRTAATTGRSMASSNSQKSSGSVAGTSGISRNSIELAEDTRNGPFFDKAASKNVTALLGKTAYLNCRVKNLGNKTMLLQVSWVRHRDIHLLTVGRYTYTSDQRFRAIHQPQTEDWILQIKYPQHRDSGIYECQVSSTPHMSHYIHLNVVEPTTEIIGAPDLYIESGSTINLTCVILNSPEPPAYIFWNHNNAIINYDSPRGGVSVVTNKGETTTSFLLIKSARPSDSGHYQCNPSNSKAKSVTVHVLNGEFPAAMQHAAQAHHLMSPSRYLLVYLFVCLCSSAFARRCMQPPQMRRGAVDGARASGTSAGASSCFLSAF